MRALLLAKWLALTVQRAADGPWAARSSYWSAPHHAQHAEDALAARSIFPFDSPDFSVSSQSVSTAGGIAERAGITLAQTSPQMANNEIVTMLRTAGLARGTRRQALGQRFRRIASQHLSASPRSCVSPSGAALEGKMGGSSGGGLSQADSPPAQA